MNLDLHLCSHSNNFQGAFAKTDIFRSCACVRVRVRACVCRDAIIVHVCKYVILVLFWKIKYIKYRTVIIITSLVIKSALFMMTLHLWFNDTSGTHGHTWKHWTHLELSHQPGHAWIHRDVNWATEARPWTMEAQVMSKRVQNGHHSTKQNGLKIDTKVNWVNIDT